MLKQVALLASAVLACMLMCIVAVVAIQELMLCDGKYQYKSVIWFVATVSFLSTIAFAYAIWTICNRILRYESQEKTRSGG